MEPVYLLMLARQIARMMSYAIKPVCGDTVKIIRNRDVTWWHSMTKFACGHVLILNHISQSRLVLQQHWMLKPIQHTPILRHIWYCERVYESPNAFWESKHSSVTGWEWDEIEGRTEADRAAAVVVLLLSSQCGETWPSVCEKENSSMSGVHLCVACCLCKPECVSVCVLVSSFKARLWVRRGMAVTLSRCLYKHECIKYS